MFSLQYKTLIIKSSFIYFVLVIGIIFFDTNEQAKRKSERVLFSLSFHNILEFENIN